jgi:hypothetical protein
MATRCVQVSERKATYESQRATHDALLALGKTLVDRENKQHCRDDKQAYLLSTIKELDTFEGNVFMTDYERTKDKNLLKARTYGLVRYIAIFKELHESMVADREEAHVKVAELIEEVSDQSEQIDSYITQLDRIDEACVDETNALIKCRKELDNLQSEIKVRDARDRHRMSTNKCRVIGNTVVTCSLMAAQISSLVYMYMFPM